MNEETSAQFQLKQIHELLIREGKLRLRLIDEIDKYASMNKDEHNDKQSLRDQFILIEETISLLVSAARDCGSTVGQVT